MSHSKEYFRNPPACRLGVLAALRNQAGHLLLVKKIYQVREGNPRPWGLVGGSVGETEKLRGAWKREVLAETGLSLNPGRLLVTDEVPASGDNAKGINWLYDTPPLPDTTEITLPRDELSEYAYVSRENLGEYLTEHGTRRACAVLDALAQGTVLELEYGYRAT
ncbi:NUDIX hydrolase [Streptomyces sp. L-9-10]|uniref:NUDIX domain-containing protein n=1 Tax=Streptomyces sp. L-9-10 TaxID=1478131 RepID=UPI00101D390E|nr:NUDIX hydrolase [Streptomyces sp. L-9-10]